MGTCFDEFMNGMGGRHLLNQRHTPYDTLILIGRTYLHRGGGIEADALDMP